MLSTANGPLGNCGAYGFTSTIVPSGSRTVTKYSTRSLSAMRPSGSFPTVAGALGTTVAADAGVAALAGFAALPGGADLEAVDSDGFLPVKYNAASAAATMA